ncbi:hypothetical protein [Mycoplasmopsis opalescens]|nr:hypothetical protein [Mycoplasmopsis opalescens]
MVQYKINKVKITLRKKWQEVAKKMMKIDAKEMFWDTLDKAILKIY